MVSHQQHYIGCGTITKQPINCDIYTEATLHTNYTSFTHHMHATTLSLISRISIKNIEADHSISFNHVYVSRIINESEILETFLKWGERDYGKVGGSVSKSINPRQ